MTALAKEAPAMTRCGETSRDRGSDVPEQECPLRLYPTNLNDVAGYARSDHVKAAIYDLLCVILVEKQVFISVVAGRRALVATPKLVDNAALLEREFQSRNMSHETERKKLKQK